MFWSVLGTRKNMNFTFVTALWWPSSIVVINWQESCCSIVLFWTTKNCKVCPNIWITIRKRVPPLVSAIPQRGWLGWSYMVMRLGGMCSDYGGVPTRRRIHSRRKNAFHVRSPPPSRGDVQTELNHTNPWQEWRGMFLGLTCKPFQIWMHFCP